MPGSICNTVLTRSRNVLARLSSPTGIVRLKMLLAPSMVEMVLPGVEDEARDDGAAVTLLALPDRISIISGDLEKAGLETGEVEVDGKASI